MIVEDKEGLRLDSYLSEELDISRSKVQKLIKEEKVLVNGKVVNSSYSVKIGDEIIIDDELDYEIKVDPEDIPLNIIYEDDDLLIINKESGMVVHPAPGHYTGTLVNALLFRYKNLAGDKFRPGIVHRLDKDTSGIVVFAKTEKSKKILQDNWNSIVKERKYVAIVEGKPSKEKDRLINYLKETSTNHVYVVDYKTDTQAITNYEIVSSNNKYSKLNIMIETGKKNQIRAQLANIGNPIVGDKKYSENYKGIKRLMLHASRLVFTDPTSKKEMVFETSIPKEFNKLISDRN